MLLVNAGSIVNATVYKYFFVIDLIGEQQSRVSKNKIYLFMFFLQFLWPLIAVFFAIKAEVQPSKVVEESKRVNFCVLLSST